MLLLYSVVSSKSFAGISSTTICNVLDRCGHLLDVCLRRNENRVSRATKQLTLEMIAEKSISVCQEEAKIRTKNSVQWSN